MQKRQAVHELTCWSKMVPRQHLPCIFFVICHLLCLRCGPESVDQWQSSAPWQPYTYAAGPGSVVMSTRHKTGP